MSLTLEQAYERWAPVYPPEPHNPVMDVEQRALLALCGDLQGRDCGPTNIHTSSNFRSDHPGGGQFLMADGAVRFVSEEIGRHNAGPTATCASCYGLGGESPGSLWKPGAYQALSTIAGGETVFRIMRGGLGGEGFRQHLNPHGEIRSSGFLRNYGLHGHAESP